MESLRWNTPEKLRSLLSELVSWKSHSLTEGEKDFPFKLKEKLLDLEYFKDNPEFVSLQKADGERSFLTALYKSPHITETVVLISHFDTVQTIEYGNLEPLAFYPEILTEKLYEIKDQLSKEVREDLESGEYLFGRGTMDMKMGLALHMGLIEKASIEKWPINLLLLTVPDEEVNSQGMREAVKELLNLSSNHQIIYKLFLNSESSFSQMPGDETHYIYSGSIGKIMPAALFYGKETHVGEPLKGMTANYIASFLTQHMEWNPLFQEQVYSERSPLPVCLQQKDLQLTYSTQTPSRAVALYNVFLMKRNAEDVMDLFESTAQIAANKCNESYRALCGREKIDGIGEVKVWRYERLYEYAEYKLGKEHIETIKSQINRDAALDEREKSLAITDKIMIQCQELAPAIILLFAPPYYPAVNSSEEPLIKDLVEIVKNTLNGYDKEIKQIHYYNGISDLSYVNYQGNDETWEAFKQNTPTWGDVYSIPFVEMKKLQAPVLNVGPFGKDAHQRTERLHMDSAFIHTPMILEKLIKSLYQMYKNQMDYVS